MIKKKIVKKKKKASKVVPSGAKALALLAAEAALDKKGFDVRVMDVSSQSPVTDMMVLVSARSAPHLRAVADGVEDSLSKAGFKASHRDRGIGGDTDWILLDFFDVMVHVFINDVRAHYALEALFRDCEIVAEFD